MRGTTLDKGYLPWLGEGGTYPGQREGGTYLGWGKGYLPWMGGGVPTLEGGTYPEQVMARAVRLLRLSAGGLSSSF